MLYIEYPADTTRDCMSTDNDVLERWCVQARALLEEVMPDLSTVHPLLHFELNLQCFVELLRDEGAGDHLKAMHFARERLQTSAAPPGDSAERLAVRCSFCPAHNHECTYARCKLALDEWACSHSRPPPTYGACCMP